jgi:hypothetical protein
MYSSADGWGSVLETGSGPDEAIEFFQLAWCFWPH